MRLGTFLRSHIQKNDLNWHVTFMKVEKIVAKATLADLCLLFKMAELYSLAWSVEALAVQRLTKLESTPGSMILFCVQSYISTLWCHRIIRFLDWIRQTVVQDEKTGKCITDVEANPQSFGILD